MGRGHFRRLFNHPQAEVVAVCDRVQARREGDWNDALGNFNVVMSQTGRAPVENMARYETHEQLIADQNVDVVLLALPTVLHSPVAVAALNAGKHVFTEKPMATNPAECDRMIAAAEKNDRKLMVGQCIRFWPQYVTIKRLVDEGRIGKVLFVTLRRVGSPPLHSHNNWMLDAAQSGGAILDLHVHDVDFAHYFLGLPDTISACGTQGPSHGIDHVVATYGYADGRYAVLEGGWAFAAPWPFDMAIAVHGERGTIEWTMTRGNDVMLYAGGEKPEAFSSEGDVLLLELDYFIECIRSNRTLERCSPASCRTSVVLAWLEKRSIETGRVLKVSEHLHEIWRG